MEFFHLSLFTLMYISLRAQAVDWEKHLGKSLADVETKRENLKHQIQRRDDGEPGCDDAVRQGITAVCKSSVDYVTVYNRILPEVEKPGEFGLEQMKYSHSTYQRHNAFYCTPSFIHFRCSLGLPELLSVGTFDSKELAEIEIDWLPTWHLGMLEKLKCRVNNLRTEENIEERVTHFKSMCRCVNAMKNFYWLIGQGNDDTKTEREKIVTENNSFYHQVLGELTELCFKKLLSTLGNKEPNKGKTDLTDEENTTVSTFLDAANNLPKYDSWVATKTEQ